MKKKTAKSILKAALLVIAIALPLLVSFLLCRYTYNRHYSTYITPYLVKNLYDDDNNEIEDAMLHIEFYFQYSKKYYKRVDDKEVKLNDQKLLDLTTFEVIEDEDGTDKLNYYFFAYNVDYKLLTRWGYVGQEPDFKFIQEDIPTLYIYLRDDNDVYRYVALSEFEDFVVKDFGVSPAADDNGDELSNFVIQYGTYSGLNFPSDDVNVAVMIDDDEGEELSIYIHEGENKLSVDRIIYDLEDSDLETFIKAYNYDAKQAGYVKYVFWNYWWWEILASIILVGILSYSYYTVITYEKEK